MQIIYNYKYPDTIFFFFNWGENDTRKLYPPCTSPALQHVSTKVVAGLSLLALLNCGSHVTVMCAGDYLFLVSSYAP